jgi:hypothetical protein
MEAMISCYLFCSSEKVPVWQSRIYTFFIACKLIVEGKKNLLKHRIYFGYAKALLYTELFWIGINGNGSMKGSCE